jgi:TIR domain
MALRSGDQFPHFMEREIRSDDFVMIICTPQYKTKFDERTSGAGYEAEIITAEISAKQNHRKFITVLARGTWTESVPYALCGKKYIDLSDVYKRQRNYPQLRSTILGTHSQPPLSGCFSTTQYVGTGSWLNSLERSVPPRIC